jgi:hypothetical protein
MRPITLESPKPLSTSAMIGSRLAAHLRSGGEQLGHGQQAGVGHASRRADGQAAGPDPVKPRPFDEDGGQTVMCSHQAHQPLAGKQGTQNTAGHMDSVS